LNTEALLYAPPAAYAHAMSTSLIYPNGVIEPRPALELKVQHLTRPPRPWGWAIHVEDRSTRVYTSEARYRSAQEAWEAGRKALETLEQGRRPTQSLGAIQSREAQGGYPHADAQRQMSAAGQGRRTGTPHAGHNSARS
jgi:hypothetical protein